MERKNTKLPIPAEAPTPQELAGLFSYNAPLIAENWSKPSKSKDQNEGVIWSVRYVSENIYLTKDYFFAQAMITKLKPGSPSAGKLRQISTHFRSLPDKPVDPRLYREVSSRSGLKGFVSLAGFGAGGSSFVGVFSVPAGSYDIVTSLSLSNDTDLIETERTADYCKLLRKDDFIFDKLIELAELAHEKINRVQTASFRQDTSSGHAPPTIAQANNNHTIPSLDELLQYSPESKPARKP